MTAAASPTAISCAPLLAARGGAPRGACLKSVHCGGSCAENPGSTLTVTCAGG